MLAGGVIIGAEIELARVAKAVSIEIAIERDDVNTPLLQFPHLVGHGLVIGIQRRNSHGDNVRLAAKLPQFVDLPTRRAVVHFHDGLQPRLAEFEVALAGDQPDPHGVPIGRIAVRQYDDAFLARTATTDQQHETCQQGNRPEDPTESKNRQGCPPELENA